MNGRLSPPFLVKKMKKVLLFLLLFSFVSAKEIFLNPDSIFIFKNRSFSVFSSYLPENAHKITFFSPGEINISSLNISFSNPECEFYSLEEKENKNVKVLEKQLQEKLFSLENLKKKIELLQRISVSEKNIDSLYERYVKISTDIHFLEKEIKNLKDKIKKLSARKLFEINYSCPEGKILKIFLTTPVNISAFQKYKITAFVDKGFLKIENLVFVKNNTDIDFKGISLRYYSYKKTSMINPPPFNGFFRPVPYVRMEASKSMPKRSYEEAETKAVFSVKDVSIPKKSSKIFNVSSDIYKATFDVYVDGYATVTPFLRAVFTPDKFFPSSYSSEYYINGFYIGKGSFPSLEKGKEHNLFFGEDTFVEVSKEKIKDFTEETFLGKKIRTVKWQYRVKNNHKKKIKITIVDRLPVSHSEKREIEYFSDIKWKKFEPNGKVILEVWLKPKEEILFSFGFKEKIED